MPKINRSLIVQYSPEQMYNLVNELDSYPQFLPWCSQTTIHRATDTEMEASIYFSHGIINKSFTTLNSLVPNTSIHMKLLEGPFRQFEGLWRFEPASEKGCALFFDLDFEFASPIIAMAAGPVFEQAIRSMMDAFVKQAAQVYETV